MELRSRNKVWLCVCGSGHDNPDGPLDSSGGLQLYKKKSFFFVVNPSTGKSKILAEPPYGISSEGASIWYDSTVESYQVYASIHNQLMKYVSDQESNSSIASGERLEPWRMCGRLPNGWVYNNIGNKPVIIDGLVYGLTCEEKILEEADDDEELMFGMAIYDPKLNTTTHESWDNAEFSVVCPKHIVKLGTTICVLTSPANDDSVMGFWFQGETEMKWPTPRNLSDFPYSHCVAYDNWVMLWTSDGGSCVRFDKRSRKWEMRKPLNQIHEPFKRQYIRRAFYHVPSQVNP